MSGIARVREKMKKKLIFEDMPPIEEIKEKTARKIYSLTKEDNTMLKKIFSKRLNIKHKTSISTLMSEAIQLLYSKEFE